MNKAYGFIEISGVVSAIEALDIMCKAAEVSFVTWERKLGGRLVTLVIEGEVEAVKASVEAANSVTTIRKPVASGILARPHDEIRRIVAISASRLKNKETKQPENTDYLKEV